MLANWLGLDRSDPTPNPFAAGLLRSTLVTLNLKP